jgi:hypothetical protein
MKAKHSKSSNNLFVNSKIFFEDFDFFGFIQGIDPLDLTDRQHYTSTITGKKKS